jgi:hypothetical protein
MMKLDAFEWKPAGHGGYRKLLGVFSERETVAEMIRLEDGGEVHIDAAPAAVQLLYVSKGKGQLGGQRVQAESTCRLQPGMSTSMSAQGSIEVLRIVMPNL